TSDSAVARSWEAGSDPTNTAFPPPPPLPKARAPAMPRRTSSSTAPLGERDVNLGRLSLCRVILVLPGRRFKPTSRLSRLSTSRAHGRHPRGGSHPSDPPIRATGSNTYVSAPDDPAARLGW